MAPSYLIIEVARLVDARSIALSIAEPPRWTPGTAVAVPLHEAERHRCIAMALWYTGAEVRARSDQGSHHRRIVIPITVRQVKVASLQRQSLSMPAPNTPRQTLPWSAPTSVCSGRCKSFARPARVCAGVAWLDTYRGLAWRIAISIPKPCVRTPWAAKRALRLIGTAPGAVGQVVAASLQRQPGVGSRRLVLHSRLLVVQNWYSTSVWQGGSHIPSPSHALRQYGLQNSACMKPGIGSLDSMRSSAAWQRGTSSARLVPCCCSRCSRRRQTGS